MIDPAKPINVSPEQSNARENRLSCHSIAALKALLNSMNPICDIAVFSLWSSLFYAFFPKIDFAMRLITSHTNLNFLELRVDRQAVLHYSWLRHKWTATDVRTDAFTHNTRSTLTLGLAHEVVVGWRGWYLCYTHDNWSIRYTYQQFRATF